MFYIQSLYGCSTSWNMVKAEDYLSNDKLETVWRKTIRRVWLLEVEILGS